MPKFEGISVCKQKKKVSLCATHNSLISDLLVIALKGLERKLSKLKSIQDTRKYSDGSCHLAIANQIAHFKRRCRS